MLALCLGLLLGIAIAVLSVMTLCCSRRLLYVFVLICTTCVSNLCIDWRDYKQVMYAQTFTSNFRAIAKKMAQKEEIFFCQNVCPNFYCHCA